MKELYKSKVMIAGIAIIVLTAGALVLSNRGGSDEEMDGFTHEDLLPQDGEVLVEGRIACLPLSSGDEVMESGCVKGIKDKDDRVYALNSISIGGVESKMDIGKKVSAVGTLEAVDATSQESSVFRYDAVLVVRAIK